MATLTATPVTTDEAEAAALEGLVPIDDDIQTQMLLREFHVLRDQNKTNSERMDVIKRTVGTRIGGAPGALTVGGKVVARLSNYTVSTVDRKALALKHPKLLARFLKFTPASRITIEDI